MTLDPGIRKTVEWLQKLGYRTTDSGDGVSKVEEIERGEALDFPHVFMVVEKEEFFDAAEKLAIMVSAIPGARIEASYFPGEACILSLLYVNDKSLEAAGVCGKPLPANLWPYGPPDHHESCCLLFEGYGYCDCKASDESDTEWGLSHAGTGNATTNLDSFNPRT